MLRKRWMAIATFAIGWIAACGGVREEDVATLSSGVDQVSILGPLPQCDRSEQRNGRCFDIEVRRGPNKDLVYHQNFNPNFSYAFYGNELGNDLPSTPLDYFTSIYHDHPENELSIRFRASHPLRTTFANGVALDKQLELHVFTRDPNEQYQALLALDQGYPVNVGEVSAWSQFAATLAAGDDDEDHGGPPFYVPNDVVIPYPVDQSKTFFELRPLAPQDFWYLGGDGPRSYANIANWRGPGTDPQNVATTSPTFGSIKALHIASHAMCTREVSIQGDILGLLKTELRKQFLDGACSGGREGNILYLDAFSYIRHVPGADTPPKEKARDGLVGGFLLRGKFHIEDHNPVINLDPCDIKFLYDYQFINQDGRIGLRPVRLRLDHQDVALCNGAFGQEGAIAKLTTGLEHTIPQTVFGKGDSRQVIDTDLGPSGDCDYLQIVDHPGADTDDLCSFARVQLESGVRAGRANLHVDPLIDKQGHDVIVDLVRDSKNWRCVPRRIAPVCDGDPRYPAHALRGTTCDKDRTTIDDDSTYRQSVCHAKGRCQFLVKAKDIDVLPDKVAIRWFDDLNDPTTSVAAFLASFALETPGNPAMGYKDLCGRAPSPVLGAPRIGAPSPTPDDAWNFYNRRFANVHTEGNNCGNRPEPPAPPPAPPPPSPPPAFTCGCHTDAECALGDTCNLTRHVCSNSCLSDADCTRNGGYEARCIIGLNLCGHQVCDRGGNGHTSIPCPSWETCQDDGPNSQRCKPKMGL
jgi:hypothetical protein